MSTTTNQMSLLDAIDFNAPEDEKPKKDKKSAAPEKSSKPKNGRPKRPLKRQPRLRMWKQLKSLIQKIQLETFR